VFVRGQGLCRRPGRGDHGRGADEAVLAQRESRAGDPPLQTHLVSRTLWPLEETFDDFTDNGIDNLVVSLYQMELDRMLFLLCFYLRLLLQKIEKYMAHIFNSDDLLSWLTQQEQ
uniref:Uncharacterized protein n=1 Tax=Aegilops tauschii subsp. strangulata TaxID=200361 RepID=A0A453QG77_AEGTS